MNCICYNFYCLVAGYAFEEDHYCGGWPFYGEHIIDTLQAATAACNADGRCKCFHCWHSDGTCYLFDSSTTSDYTGVNAYVKQ